MNRRPLTLTLLLSLPLACPAEGGSPDFVNWESPHVHPLDVTPDGSRLLAVNTADNRLEVLLIDSKSGALLPEGSIPVGLDPVSVRCLGNDEAWVVNHISDSVSVVDLSTMNVVATLPTGDEPADVIFAGEPTRAYVSVSQLNRIELFDPLDITIEPTIIPLQAEDPRALATDGEHVLVAVFESGNRTTILDSATVSSELSPYPDSPNPPPNAETLFDPPINGTLPDPPPTSLIVRKDSQDKWLDDNARDWSPATPWDLHDHDVAIIDTSSQAVSYTSGLMNANMALAVNAKGSVLVVGTDASNEVRFEPNVNGVFVQVIGARFGVNDRGDAQRIDLNPHLDYSTPTEPQPVRDQSIGDPRGVAWNGADRVFIGGMGSNNLLTLDGSLDRIGLTEVGEGPTGVCFDPQQQAVYVLNRFDASISRVDSNTLLELERVPFYDPTPNSIRVGRKHLYDTHATSGLGQASCASCHIDARMDQLGWDLGDPSGELKKFNQICNFNLFGGCDDWHPMKGPLTTQTLVGIIGTEPFHWRGDREDLAAFNGAFETLMGDDEQLTAEQMQQFTDFVATLTMPPNPFRNIDNSLPTRLPSGGNAQTGRFIFDSINVVGQFRCVNCHSHPAGTNNQITSDDMIQASQGFNTAQLRNLYEKTGFDRSSLENSRGFGFAHDGSIQSVVEFLESPRFSFFPGKTGVQQRLDLDAYMLSFSVDTHAGVGVQATIGGRGSDQSVLRDQLLTIADSGEVGLVARGVRAGEQRGLYYLGGDLFQSDRTTETLSVAELDAGSALGAEMTYTLVPLGSEIRIGVDRDADGFFDRDELDQCADPANPDNVPRPGGCQIPGDINGDGQVDVTDLVLVIVNWGPCNPQPGVCPADLDRDGIVSFADLIQVIINWG